MFDWQYAPVVGAVGLLTFRLMHRRLLRAAQPLRLEISRIGKQILNHPSISSKTKRDVEFMLSSLFNMRATLFLGIFVVPFLCIMIIVRQRFFTRIRRERTSMNPEIRALMEEMADLHESVTLANHPILMSVIKAEMLFLVPLCVLIRGLIWGTVPAHQDRGVLLGVLETKYRSMDVHPFSHAHA